MNCKQFEKNVTAYVEGAIQKDLRGLMDAHRSECPVCARLARAHELVLFSLNTTKSVKAPSGLRERILAAAVQEKAVEKIVPFPWRSLAAELGAAAGFLIVGIIVFHGQISYSLAALSGIVRGVKLWFTEFDLGTFDISRKIDLLAILERGLSVLNESIHLLVEPITLPYIAFPIPLYYFAAMAVLAWSIWYYFGSPLIPPGGIQARLQK